MYEALNYPRHHSGQDSYFSVIRQRIFDDWAPPWNLDSNPRSRILQSAWRELRAVADVGAWSSVIVQSGRLMEATIRAALPADPISNRSGKPRGLYALLRTAYANDLLINQFPGSKNAGEALRKLRNLAAHLDGLEQPSELSATQAIVILLVFVEALTPEVAEQETPQGEGKTKSDEWFLENWGKTNPNFLIRRFLDSPVEIKRRLLEDQAYDIFDRMLQASSARALSRLPTFMRTVPAEYKYILGICIHRRFVALLCRLAKRNTMAGWSFFIDELHNLGLKYHQAVLIVLLPYDSDWLLKELRSGTSPHKLVRRVIKVRRFNREEWRVLGADLRLANKIGTEAWTTVSMTESFTRNRFLLARYLPMRLRKSIIFAAPPGVLTTYIYGLRQVALSFDVAHVALLNPELGRADRNEIKNAIRTRIRKADLQVLRSLTLLPWYRGGSSKLAAEVFDLCIEREPQEDERHTMAQLLLAVWLCSPRHARQVCARATELCVPAHEYDWAFWLFFGLASFSSNTFRLRVHAGAVGKLGGLEMPVVLPVDEAKMTLIGIAAAFPNEVTIMHRISLSVSVSDSDNTLPGHKILHQAFVQSVPLEIAHGYLTTNHSG
jgi:hypothetical protein